MEENPELPPGGIPSSEPPEALSSDMGGGTCHIWGMPRCTGNQWGANALMILWLIAIGVMLVIGVKWVLINWLVPLAESINKMYLVF